MKNFGVYERISRGKMEVLRTLPDKTKIKFLNTLLLFNRFTFFQLMHFQIHICFLCNFWRLALIRNRHTFCYNLILNRNNKSNAFWVQSSNLSLKNEERFLNFVLYPFPGIMRKFFFVSHCISLINEIFQFWNSS